MSNRESMENHQQPLEQNSARAAQTPPVTAPSSLAPAVLQKLGLNGAQTPANMEHLHNALRHKDWFVRARAIRTLGQLGALAPLEPLLAALSDEHVSVRVTAVHALANLGSRMPVERLVAALHDGEWQVREAVVFALDESGLPVAREPLMVASHDPDIVVRTAAEQVLQQDNKNTTIKRGPMRQADFQTDEYRPSSGEKLIIRTPHRSMLWWRVGVSAAVVFVILNIVAWTAIVQHLRPSRSIDIVGSSHQPTPMPTPPFQRPTPTPSLQTPTPIPFSTLIGKMLYTFACQPDGIHTLAWSPDGKRLGSTCLDATARDATTGNHIFSYEQPSASVLSISWSSDGKRIQASSQTVKVCDAATGRIPTCVKTGINTLDSCQSTGSG